MSQTNGAELWMPHQTVLNALGPDVHFQFIVHFIEIQLN